jgi:hypothetical protein
MKDHKPPNKILIFVIKLSIKMYQNIENFGKCLKKIDLAKKRKLKRKMERKNDKK